MISHMIQLTIIILWNSIFLLFLNKSQNISPYVSYMLKFSLTEGLEGWRV